MTDVLVVAELIDGGFRRNTLSAVTVAQQVAKGTGGAFDILAVSATEFLFVQVKTNRLPDREEIEKMRGFLCPPNARKIIHIWKT